MIGDYKGIPNLINAFQKVEGKNYRLLIAGRPRSQRTKIEVEKAASGDFRIMTLLRHLSDKELAEMHAACDKIVAPFRKYLHSGSLVYAPCAKRQVLTPATPFACDLAKTVGNGWIQIYTGLLTDTTLRMFIEAKIPDEEPDLTEFTAYAAGSSIVKFVRTLMESPARP
jgi:hypothetical protein